MNFKPLNSDLASRINDTGWIKAPLATGIYNLSNSAQPLRYRRKNGIVYITGVVKVAGKNADVQKTITTLPAGFRITSGSYYYFINGATGATMSRFILSSSGTITLEWVRRLQDGSTLSGDIAWIGINISYPI